MTDWSGRNLILHFLFLLIAFISLIRRESEINTCSYALNFSSQTYTGFIVTGRPEPDQFIQDTRRFVKCEDVILLSAHPHRTPGYSTLRFTIQFCTNIQCNTALQYSPINRVINILQRQNIWHQSPDDSTDPLIV